MMTKNRQRISSETKARYYKMADSVLSVAILLFIFKAATLIDSQDYRPIDYFIVYVLIAVSCSLQTLAAYQKDKIIFIKNICFAAIFLIAGTAILFTGVSVTGAVILLEAFLTVVLVNRVLFVILDKRLSYKLISGLVAAAVVLMMVGSFWLKPQELSKYLLVHAIMVAGRVLAHVIYISFSRMRFGVLRKIIRKTFAAEILFGLVLLIGSFSFVFQALEPDIKTYFDAIWFCFSVVTTIGFGDLAVASLLSRALAIILGIYGIFVVALVTSIIVNFYNEVKDENKDEAEESPEGSDKPKSIASAQAKDSD